MELLKEIKDKELPRDGSALKLREASRIVAFDDQGLIPLMFVSRLNYHKLPGGGIKPGEDRRQALVRETLEEAGSEIKVTGELGMIVEFRSKWSLKQVSYCYIGKIISKGEPDFTAKEIDNGFELGWVTLDNAIRIVEDESPADYAGSFVHERDLAFLKKAKETIKRMQTQAGH